MQQSRQLIALQLREPGHAALALVNQVSDLLIGHLAFYAEQRRKRWQDAFPLFAVADGAVVRIGLGALLVRDSGAWQLGCLRSRDGRSTLEAAWTGLDST